MLTGTTFDLKNVLENAEIRLTNAVNIVHSWMWKKSMIKILLQHLLIGLD